jgi:hypothetical protein
MPLDKGQKFQKPILRLPFSLLIYKMKNFIVLLICILSLAQALPVSSKFNQKREDPADRSQDAAIGGALRGFVIPDLQSLIPTNPLGGQAPDDD